MIEKSRRYKRIGDRLVENDEDLAEIKINDVRIAYLASDKEKVQNHKIIFADCRKVAEQYSWACPYDFMITVYEPNCLDFNRKQLEILIKHELLHIGIDYSGNEPSYYVAPHDIEEFYSILNEYGTEWQRSDKDA